MNAIDITNSKPAIFKTFNPATRKYEVVDPSKALLPVGTGLIRMSWSRALQVYVAIYGESLYKVNADGDAILQSEEE